MKSLAEGFRLAVTEEMWKRKPVIASAVGGIRDQVTSDADRLLIQDPADTGALARAQQRLCYDRDPADAFGCAAQRRVMANYLDDRHRIRTTELLEGPAPHRRGAAGARI